MVENDIPYIEEEDDSLSIYNADTAFSEHSADIDNNSEVDEAWWYTSKYIPVKSDEEQFGYSVCRQEIAWAGCLEGEGTEWWYYLEVNALKNDRTGRMVPVPSTETIWAGQFTDVGLVTYDPDLNTISIRLTDGWRLQDVDSPVKIQGYNVLPSDTPSSGWFTTYNGRKTTVRVAPYKYYAIRLDVQLGT